MRILRARHTSYLECQRKPLSVKRKTRAWRIDPGIL